MYHVGAIVGTLALENQMTPELNAAANETKKATKQMETAFAAVAAASAAVLVSMAALTTATADYRDATVKMARSAGATTKEFSALRHAGELAGVSAEELTTTLAKLTTTEVQKKLQGVGIAVKDTAGGMKSSGALLEDFAEKVSKITDPTARAAHVVDVLGARAGPKLVSLLAGGRKAMREAAAEAEKLGIAFDERAGEAAELFNDNLDRLKKGFQGVRDSIGEAIIDFVNTSKVFEAVTEAAAAVGQVIRDLPEPVKQTAIAAVALTAGLGMLLGALVAIKVAAPLVGAAITTAFGPVGLVIAGVVVTLATLTAVTMKVYKEWDQFSQFMAPAIDGVKNAIQGFKDIHKPITNAIREIAKLLPSFEPMRKAFESFRKASGDVDVFGSAIRAVMAPVVVTVTAVTGAFQALRIVVNGLIQNGPKLVNVFGELGASAAAFAAGPAGIATWFATGGGTRLYNAFAAMGTGMSDSMAEAGESIKKTGREIETTMNNLIVKTKKKTEEIANAPTSGGGKPPPGIEQNFRSEFDALGQSLDFQGIAERIAKQFAESLFNGLKTEMNAKRAVAFVQAFGMVAQAMMAEFDKAISQSFERASNKVQSSLNQFSLTADVFSAIWRKQKDAELQHFIDVENAKIDALRQASFERLAIVDEEFAHQKRLLDQELQDRLAAIELDRQSRESYARDKAIVQAQEVTDVAIVNEDARLMEEEAQRAYQERLRELEQKTQDKRREETDKTKAEVELAEEEKAAKVEQMNARREEEEKRHTKTRALIEYNYALAAYAISQQQARAAAGLAFAQSTMAAIQAGINMTAATLGFGFAAGAALTAALTAMAGVGYSSSIATIASMPRPLPPAALFAEKGGVVGGMSHRNGGTLVEAQRGEAFLSTDLTERLDTMTREGSMATVIKLEAGAVVVHGNMDDRAIETIVTKLAERIQQRRY